MSINIFMLPLAIALAPAMITMRVVMGEEKFNEFMKADDLKIPTNITNENELKKIVTNAGYDFKDYFNVKKTHCENRFFTGELGDGKYVAVFNIHDDQRQIEIIKNRLTKSAGKIIFENIVFNDNLTDLKDVEKSEKISEQVEYKTRVYPTNFADESLLEKTLTDYDIKYKKFNGTFCLEFEDIKIDIFKLDKAYYEAKIMYKTAISKACFYLNAIDEEYKKNVQNIAYENIIKKIESRKDMHIESQEVLEDDSIQIVISC